MNLGNFRIVAYSAAATVLLQACVSTQVNPTQSLALGPGQGYVAIQLDLHQPNRELLFASAETGGHLQIDNAPAGKSLYLFPVPAGHYCMSMYYIVGEQRIYPHDQGCFDVTAGRLTFSGYLDPAVLYGNIAVGQIRDDAAGQVALRNLYPQIAAQYLGTVLQASSSAPMVQSSPIDGCYANEPTEVVLTGTLIDGLDRTPIKNNSINSNKLERAYALVFASPICTLGNLQRGGVDRPYSDIRELRLIYATGSSALYGAIGQYKGKTIRCRGQIFDLELRIADVNACQPVPDGK